MPKVGMVMLMPTEGEVGDLLVLLIFYDYCWQYYIEDEEYFTRVKQERGSTRLSGKMETDTNNQSVPGSPLR